MMPEKKEKKTFIEDFANSLSGPEKLKLTKQAQKDIPKFQAATYGSLAGVLTAIAYYVRVGHKNGNIVSSGALAIVLFGLGTVLSCFAGIFNVKFLEALDKPKKDE